MQVSQSSGLHVLCYQGRYYPFNKSQIVIGSDPNCDVRIENNPRVLPHHARLVVQQEHVFLQYLDRNAPIWVNGVPMAMGEAQLPDRAEIAVGDQETRMTLLLNWINPHAVENQAAADPTARDLIPARPKSPAIPAQPNSPIPASNAIRAVTPPITTPVTAPRAAQNATRASSTDTTRYLCAAGYLDEHVQEYVMRNVVYEERRAMGESYGVDMAAVVSWCKVGRTRINARDTLLAALLLLVCTILAVSVIPLISKELMLYNQGSQYYGEAYEPFGTLLSSLWDAGLGALLALVLCPIVILILESAAKRSGFVSLFVLFLLLGLEINFLLAFFLTVGLWLIIFVELLTRHYGEQVASLGKNQFEKNTRPVSLNLGLETKLRESFAPRRRNVVVYSGYEPFAGAGYNLGGWSFVIDTTRGACSKPLQGKRDKPQPFMLNELYTAVRQRLEGLGLGDALEIEEKLYINGQHVRENPSFFDETALHPLASVDQQLVEQFKEQPTEDTRYYQCIRFSFWRGEVVLSVFLRFVRRGSELFVEIDYLLLPPLLPAYHWMDQKKVVPTASKVWELFKRSFDAPIKLWFGSFRRLLRASTYQAQQRRLARVARRSLSFDYGAATSLRQVASDSKYHHFFQKLDKEMYLKIAEQQLLESIMQFLDEHCIDTTELRQRQEAILNTGVIVGGDTINIGSVASGSRVQATTVNTAYSAAALAGQERMRWD